MNYFYIVSIIIFFLVILGESVPPEYCLKPLNASDCNAPPKPVFSYYKPGSRCEIEIWRGCPTVNKFANEFICSHHCIGKFMKDIEEDFTTFKPAAAVAVEIKEEFPTTEPTVEQPGWPAELLTLPESINNVVSNIVDDVMTDLDIDNSTVTAELLLANVTITRPMDETADNVTELVTEDAKQEEIPEETTEKPAEEAETPAEPAQNTTVDEPETKPPETTVNTTVVTTESVASLKVAQSHENIDFPENR